MHCVHPYYLVELIALPLFYVIDILIYSDEVVGYPRLGKATSSVISCLSAFQIIVANTNLKDQFISTIFLIKPAFAYIAISNHSLMNILLCCLEVVTVHL